MDEWKTFIGQWLQAPHIPQPEVVGYTNARPSWHLQERILDTALLYIIRDGAMHAELPTQQFDLKRHDALWLPPGVKHTFMLAKPAGALRVYHFRFGIPRDVKPPYPHAAALHDAPDLLRVAAECHSDWTNHTDIDRYQLLVADLLLLFQRSLQEQNLNNRKRLNSNQRRVMWTWLQTNHPQLWNSHALATELNYHPAYFARIFKRG